MNYKYLVPLIVGLSGCASLTDEGSLLADRSQEYKKAKSIERPLTQEDTGGQYLKDSLYPVPELPAGAMTGQLLKEVPRVKSTFIPLEQDAILLNKTATYDRVLFTDLYLGEISKSIDSFLKDRGLEAGDIDVSDIIEPLLNTSQVSGDLQSSSQVSGDFQQVVVTEWKPASELGYPEPGFWKRLFGAKKEQHQFAFLVSRPQTSSAATQGLSDYKVQLHMLHRTASLRGKKQSEWQTSTDEDPILSLEVVNFVDHLKREVALASAGQIGDMSVTLEFDGNNLPYLAITDRFAFVWEALLNLIPRETWRITDLDRSKGIMFIKTKNKETTESLGLEEFRLQLIEGPQTMLLSVETGDDQPADAVSGERILKVLLDKFTKLIEVKK